MPPFFNYFICLLSNSFWQVLLSFFCTMDVIPMKKTWLIVVVDDLHFGIRNKYDTFDWIVNKNLEDTSYAYLHYDLLHNTPLMTITFKVKSPHIKMHEQYLQKWHVCEGWKFQHWINDHCVINHCFWTWVGSCVFHMDSIRKFISFF